MPKLAIAVFFAFLFALIATGAARSDSIQPVTPRRETLTQQEMAMARAAWSYFERAYQEETGLVNSITTYPSTTMWDTASYLSALVAAKELKIIDERTFYLRSLKVLGTIRKMSLFKGELPNKVYNTKTAQKVNYQNRPGEVGFSALDIGRMLVWLKIMAERYPVLSNSVESIVMQWKFCNVISPDGDLMGAFLDKGGTVKYAQEGRLGYEEYAAKGFELWGFRASKARSPEPVSFEDIYGIRVPVDARDPRTFKTMNYVLTESYILDGIELGWDQPDDKTAEDEVYSDGWRAEFATRVYLAQQRRYEDTGILTARSEHQVDGPPYFVYDSVFSDGYAWNTLDTDGNYVPDRAAVALKAAIGMWALWPSPYTDRLFDAISNLYDPKQGFYEGLYENGQGYIPLQTANNNGIILAALLFKEQGPLLRWRNNEPRSWPGSGPSAVAKCRPGSAAAGSCCCGNANLDVKLDIAPAEFTFCKIHIQPAAHPFNRQSNVPSSHCGVLNSITRVFRDQQVVTPSCQPRAAMGDAELPSLSTDKVLAPISVPVGGILPIDGSSHQSVKVAPQDDSAASSSDSSAAVQSPSRKSSEGVSVNGVAVESEANGAKDEMKSQLSSEGPPLVEQSRGSMAEPQAEVDGNQETQDESGNSK